MIDIEKFICSLLEDHPEGVAIRSDIHKALKDQGLEYKEGKIVPIEDNWHKWTIQDTKEGDVLCSGQIILLFKKWEDSDWNFAIAYAGIDISGKLQITNEHWLISNYARPATKEQRDTLFAKMHEAGYEWDADKKELRKVEQKPVAWSEDDEKIYNRIYDIIHNAAFSNCDVDEDGKECGEYAKITEWFKSLKNRIGCKNNKL